MAIIVHTLFASLWRYERFPKDEMYRLSAKIGRSAVKISSDITDGYGKKVTGEDENPLISLSSLSFDWDIRETSQRILIVNSDSLEATLKLLRGSVVRSSRSLTQVGFLEKDIQKMKTWVADYKGSD